MTTPLRALALTTAATLATATLLAGSFDARAAAPAAKAEFVLRVGTIAPTGTPWWKLLQRMSKRIESDSGGRIDVKLYPNGKLGSENTLVRRCQKGQIGGIAVSNGALGNAVPELYLTEIPYLFASFAAADKALDASTSLVTKLMKAKGFIFYMWGENGYRHFASREKFFTSPAELKGMKMRSQPAKPHVMAYQALGASASTIAAGEVTTSLASGVVSGYDNTLLFGYATQWYKEVKYVTLSAHIYQAAIVTWCKPWFDKLPEDLQKVVTTVPDGEAQWGRKLVRAMNKLLEKKYEEEGVQLKRLTDAQRAAFKARTDSVLTTLRGETSPEGRELLTILGAK
jgi:TRAP-type C4-dicarboxylate transport system substrate-binding protein